MLQYWTVLEVLNSIEDKEDWATHRDELRRCFSTNKTRVHAADLLYRLVLQGH